MFLCVVEGPAELVEELAERWLGGSSAVSELSLKNNPYPYQTKELSRREATSLLAPFYISLCSPLSQPLLCMLPAV